MSGYTDDAIMDHGVLESGTHLLHKPFSEENLIRKVREVLDADTVVPPAVPAEACDSHKDLRPDSATGGRPEK